MPDEVQVPMTMRDEFAKAAMAVLLAENTNDTCWGKLATWSYQMADEMLEAREED